MMEVYAQPIRRVAYGQNKLMSLYSGTLQTQRNLYFKYATIINSFLSGIAADILRMRVKQVAEERSMSVKTFLDCYKDKIIPALNYDYKILILVYPPHNISRDLGKWNTRLLCTVLRASGCLELHERDDVRYIAKIYSRYFHRKHVNFGSGKITHKGHLAKREWIRTCSAVLRLVDVVDDAGLMKEVRNFICRVEMGGKAFSTRKDTQFRLDSMLSEMVANKPAPKYLNENLTDEAKQKARRKSLKRKETIRQRPQSADARLGMIKTNERNSYSDVSIRKTDEYKPTFSNKSDSSIPYRKRNTIHRSSFHRQNESARNSTTVERVNKDNILEVRSFEHKSGSTNEHSKIPDKTDKVRKRPSSAIVRNTTTNTYVVRRPKSATQRPKMVENFQRSRDYRVKDTSTHSELSIRSCPGSARSKRPTVRSCPSSARSDRSNRPTTSILKVQWPSRKLKHGNVNENNATTSRKDFKKRKQIQREHSKVSFSEDTNTTSTTRPESAQPDESKKKRTHQRSLRNIKKEIIRVPTAEAISTESDGIRDRDFKLDKSVSKERVEKTEKAHILTDKKQKRTATEKQTTNSTEEKADLNNYQTKGFKQDNSEVLRPSDKRKVFDDNMKKMANDVLVHQQIHEAARNPLLQDKEFVDEFFSFLNENHVTKKFLRTQLTEPRFPWKLPNGKQAHFSFFLAFVFRHIGNKDVTMVTYVVEKMLLRMRCKHSVTESKLSLLKSNTDESGHGDKDAISTRAAGRRSFSPDYANKRRSYKEFLQSSKYGLKYHQGKSAEIRSLPRERSVTPSEARNRSQSASKIRSLSESEDERPQRSTSITDNQCWKCLQKDMALTACVNWRNRYLCDLLISEGVPYKEEHLSAAVNANDLVTLVKIVYFLRHRGVWDASSKEAKNALFLARKHRIQKMVEFFTEEGVKDERTVNRSTCTPCYIA